VPVLDLCGHPRGHRDGTGAEVDHRRLEGVDEAIEVEQLAHVRGRQDEHPAS
jgi:hypothetical protein